MLLGVLEMVARFTPWKDAAQNNRWILIFVCATALASAACGWMLASAGGYDVELLKWHRLLGLFMAGACLIALALRHCDWLRGYRISLLVALTLLAITGHLGGTITHGRGFLTRHAPALLPPLQGYAMSRSGPEPAWRVMQQPVFAGVVQPILQRHCVSCHNAEKHKAELRLDSFAFLLQGGQNGPVIKPGQARGSSLIERMLLPLDADGHMPPEGQPSPSPEEIAVLKWWINSGAPVDEKIGNLKLAPELQRLVSIVLSKSELKVPVDGPRAN